VVLVRRGRLASLSGRQRAWLRLAVADAADRSTDLVEARERTRTLVSMCQLGARFAVASTKDLVALRAAFAPAYAGLTRDAPTRSAIAQILRLKRSLPRPPPPSLAVPVRCAPTQPAPSAALVTAPNLNGTYRYAITRAEATRAGMIDPGDVYPQVTTIMLKDGNVRGGCFGPEGATYTIAGDRITFHSGSYGYDMVADVTKHGDGDLRFSPVPPIEQGDAFTCFTKTWIKIA
jgi:hypothetical protein